VLIGQWRVRAYSIALPKMGLVARLGDYVAHVLRLSRGLEDDERLARPVDTQDSERTRSVRGLMTAVSTLWAANGRMAFSGDQLKVASIRCG
jgi:hypothetical protein